jgi:hypothetical protein
MRLIAWRDAGIVLEPGCRRCSERTLFRRAGLMPKAKIKSKLAVQRDELFLIEGPEVSIFLACASRVDELRVLARDYECGELTRIAFSRRSTIVVAELCKLVAATERFDIVHPLMDFGKFSPFFWSWYNWWHDFLWDFTPDQVCYLERKARESGSARSAHRPKNDWVQYRHTPAFALVVT